MNRLIVPAPIGDTLRAHLLKDELETAGILLGHAVPTSNGDFRVLYRDFYFAPPDAYVIREAQRVELHPNFLALTFKRARESKLSVFLTHTHPWHGPVNASAVDIAGEAILFPALFRRVPASPHGRLI